MATKVGINGFGRIGRQVLKAIRDYHPKTLDVVALTTLAPQDDLAHLLKYDSNYGRFNGSLRSAINALIIDGKPIKVFKEPILPSCRGATWAWIL